MTQACWLHSWRRRAEQKGSSEMGQRMRDMMDRLRIVAELLAFLWVRRLWWLIPMVVALMLIGLLAILAQTSPVAPFIYTLF